MAIEPERIVITYQDYMALPEDGKRWEVFEGEIDMAPAPNIPYQAIVGNLFMLLVPHVRAHSLGRVFVAPCDVVLSDITILQPDLLFVSRERALIVTRERSGLARSGGRGDLADERPSGPRDQAAAVRKVRRRELLAA